VSNRGRIGVGIRGDCVPKLGCIWGEQSVSNQGSVGVRSGLRFGVSMSPNWGLFGVNNRGHVWVEIRVRDWGYLGYLLPNSGSIWGEQSVNNSPVIQQYSKVGVRLGSDWGQIGVRFGVTYMSPNWGQFGVDNRGQSGSDRCISHRASLSYSLNSPLSHP
jgi:hypothetical protein